ncbi:RNA polymerase sigma factor [Methylocapsa palsarum]|uniref:RNA polymerase sigma-70 factor, ECF subfamily n=1 Tax=Methylocapsa palsarum TaxID=1612308 RepID=A0A1I4BNJ7_9HYPH|nr:RNA polymerase sigma factor [Methylocapsa palsarum]SFK69421.1 RNA polymerase sigma-70 factor, ECF subfamily [Methylocapsa palsarum]
MPESRSKFLEDLFALSRRELLQILTRRVGAQDAPDLVQETYLRLLRHQETAPIEEPRAFLHTIAINLARDYRRRRRTQQKHIDLGFDPEALPSAAPQSEQQIEANDRMRRLLDAVEDLPPRCRQVLIMRRFEDLHQTEIAARLGISRNMVEKHLRLALHRLQSALNQGASK